MAAAAKRRIPRVSTQLKTGLLFLLVLAWMGHFQRSHNLLTLEASKTERNDSSMEKEENNGEMAIFALSFRGIMITSYNFILR